MLHNAADNLGLPNIHQLFGTFPRSIPVFPFLFSAKLILTRLGLSDLLEQELDRLHKMEDQRQRSRLEADSGFLSLTSSQTFLEADATIYRGERGNRDMADDSTIDSTRVAVTGHGVRPDMNRSCSDDHNDDTSDCNSIVVGVGNRTVCSQIPLASDNDDMDSKQKDKLGSSSSTGKKNPVKFSKADSNGDSSVPVDTADTSLSELLDDSVESDDKMVQCSKKTYKVNSASRIPNPSKHIVRSCCGSLNSDSGPRPYLEDIDRKFGTADDCLTAKCRNFLGNDNDGALSTDRSMDWFSEIDDGDFIVSTSKKGSLNLSQFKFRKSRTAAVFGTDARDDCHPADVHQVGFSERNSSKMEDVNVMVTAVGLKRFDDLCNKQIESNDAVALADVSAKTNRIFVSERTAAKLSRFAFGGTSVVSEISTSSDGISSVKEQSGADKRRGSEWSVSSVDAQEQRSAVRVCHVADGVIERIDGVSSQTDCASPQVDDTLCRSNLLRSCGSTVLPAPSSSEDKSRDDGRVDVERLKRLCHCLGGNVDKRTVSEGDGVRSVTSATLGSSQASVTYDQGLHAMPPGSDHWLQRNVSENVVNAGRSLSQKRTFEPSPVMSIFAPDDADLDSFDFGLDDDSWMRVSDKKSKKS